MSAKVSCPVLRGGERGDSRTSPDNFYKGIQSEDKLDGVIIGNKRTEETA